VGYSSPDSIKTELETCQRECPTLYLTPIFSSFSHPSLSSDSSASTITTPSSSSPSLFPIHDQVVKLTKKLKTLFGLLNEPKEKRSGEEIKREGEEVEREEEEDEEKEKEKEKESRRERKSINLFSDDGFSSFIATPIPFNLIPRPPPL
jgi:hypothetical protein